MNDGWQRAMSRGMLPAPSPLDAGDGLSNNWRWFLGSAVVIPVLLAIGVYWLHQSPIVAIPRAGDPVIQVRLVQPPAAAVEHKPAAAQVNPPIADFRSSPPMEAEQIRSSPAEEPTPLPVRTATRRDAIPPDLQATSRREPAPGGGISPKFQRLLLAHIERYRRYPDAARFDGMQGTVQVLFVMRRDGSVLDVRVKSSSGRAVLDNEAIETIRRAQPLPLIPSELPDQLNILLPVAFDLP